MEQAIDWIRPDELLLDNIPVELKHLHRWVNWRFEEHAKGDLKKVPINPASGRRALVTDLSTWASYEDAFAAVQTYNGIGFVLTDKDPYAMIDLDDCRNPISGDTAAEARRIARIMMSYTGITPSRSGLRILVRGSLPEKRKRKDAIEFYDRLRFTTLTGHLFKPGVQQLGIIRGRQSALDKVYFEIFPDLRGGMSDDEIVRRTSSTQRGEALLAGSIEGYPSQSEADLALCGMLAAYTNDFGQIDRIFRGCGLMRPKWDEVHGRATYGQMTIETALKGRLTAPVRYNTQSVQPNFFSIPELFNRPEVPTRFIWDQILPGGGCSVLVAKPKVGKSTLALNLLLAVARGHEFLEHATERCNGIYFGLSGELHEADLRDFLTKREAKDVQNVEFYLDPPPSDLVGVLKQRMKADTNYLIIIDTLQKATNMKDLNDYAEVTTSITKFMNFIVKTESHLMFIHHARKHSGSDPADAILGSTAISGAVDTVLIMDRVGAKRTLTSRVRSGTELPLTYLSFDRATGELELLPKVVDR